MLEVDVKKIKEYNLLLSNLIQSYITNQQNLEFHYKDLLSHWINNKATTFFSKVDSNNIDNKKLINNLEDVLKTSQLLVQNYEANGVYIECDLESKDYIVNKLDTYIQKLTTLYVNLNNLGDVSFYPKRKVLYNEKKNILNECHVFKDIKDKTKRTYSTIINIEKEIGNRLGNISISKTSIDNTPSKFKSEVNEQRVDVNELELESKKIEYYIKQQITMIEDIRKNLNNIIGCYNSKNSPRFSELNDQLYSSLKNNYNNNVQFLNEIKLTIQDAIQLEKMNINNWERL